MSRMLCQSGAVCPTNAASGAPALAATNSAPERGLTARANPRAFGKALVQRELATPEPAAPRVQPALTADEIARAIAFNSTRYSREHTEEIQDLIGTTPTGTWTEADILAIADIQERYRLTKDGIVGTEMFRFLDRELRAEGVPRDDDHCILSFFVRGFPAIFRPAGAGQHQLQGHFRVEAQMPQRCNCSQFEYRQFIRGHFERRRGGGVTDLSPTFTNLPAGALTPNFNEDGDTSVAVVNYGHRADPPDTSVENHYIDDTGADDQANGCRYRAEDFPGWTTLTTAAGDVYSGEIEFRGELQRNGRVIRNLRWFGLRGRFTT